MKKMYFLFMLAGSLLAFNQRSIAQQEPQTSKTATTDKGYTVMNPGEPILIYKYVHRAHVPKETEKYPTKYFFTTSTNDVLLPLTKMDLKKAFPANHPFHDAIDENFKEDKELINYDNFHKMYKVSWLIKNHA